MVTASDTSRRWLRPTRENTVFGWSRGVGVLRADGVSSGHDRRQRPARVVADRRGVPEPDAVAGERRKVRVPDRVELSRVVQQRDERQLVEDDDHDGRGARGRARAGSFRLARARRSQRPTNQKDERHDERRRGQHQQKRAERRSAAATRRRTRRPSEFATIAVPIQPLTPSRYATWTARIAPNTPTSVAVTGPTSFRLRAPASTTTAARAIGTAKVSAAATTTASIVSARCATKNSGARRSASRIGCETASAHSPARTMVERSSSLIKARSGDIGLPRRME